MSTRYLACDASGLLVAVHWRLDDPGGKRMWWELPNGTAGLGGLSLKDLPLYQIDCLNGATFTVLVEGEKTTEALAAIGVSVVGAVTGASGTPSRGPLAELTGLRVYLWSDNDDVGRGHMIRIGAALAGIAADVRWIEWSDAPEHGDAADFIAAGGTREDLLALIEAARPFDQTTSDSGPAPAMTLAEALDAVAGHLCRFVHFARPEHADAIALWAAHTHAPLERLEQSPILALTSAVKQSGKTKVLDVLEFLVARPWRITRPSEAVLFRKIDRDQPTVLLDEVDAIFGDKSASTEGVRSIFNSGNRKGTTVPRAVPAGRGFELVEFDVFCPKATAGIGGLPDTILDRAIVIPMERRARSEAIEKLRGRTSSQLGAPLRAALTVLMPSIPDLTVADAALPLELDDRAQDGWEPLIAIADAAGGQWPARARAAAIAIFGQRSSTDDSHQLRLLADTREVFGDAPAFLPTVILRDRLTVLEASPWGDVRGKPITANYLARLLKSFEIRPSRERVAGEHNPVHGYRRSDFEDAWGRYLPAPTGTTDTTGTDRSREAPTKPLSVPDVPDVPAHAVDGPLVYDLATAAWRLPGDDSEWVVGSA